MMAQQDLPSAQPSVRFRSEPDVMGEKQAKKDEEEEDAEAEGEEEVELFVRPRAKTSSSVGGFQGFRYPRARQARDVPVYSRYMGHPGEPRLADLRYAYKRQGRPWYDKEIFGCRPLGESHQYGARLMIYLLKVGLRASLTYQPWIITTIAGLAIWGAYEWKLYAELPISLLATAIIFPLSLGINSSYARRERILLDFASMKANILTSYQLWRNWSRNRDIPEPLHVDGKRIFLNLLRQMEQFLTHNGTEKTLFKIYRNFDRLKTIDELSRQKPLELSTLVGNAYASTRALLLDFERVRTAFEFRSAAELRAFGLFAISTLGILWAPHFAYIGALVELSGLKTILNGAGAAIYPGCLSVLALSLLNEVYFALEDPFDDIGGDDLNFAWLFEVSHFMFDDTHETPYEEQAAPLIPKRLLTRHGLSTFHLQPGASLKLGG